MIALNENPEPLHEPRGLYVQYGCGLSCPPGWVNFDISPTLRLQRLPLIGRLFKRGQLVFPNEVRLGDIVKGLPVADGSADGAYASHVLEHLSFTDFRIALGNTFRILKPGGIFRLVVPDLEGRARKYLEMLQSREPTANSWFMRATYLGVENHARGIRATAQNIFGNSSHLWMWDEGSMTAALQAVGFVDVRRCALGDCRDHAFRVVEDAARFYDDSIGIAECAMEAIKPKPYA